MAVFRIDVKEVFRDLDGFLELPGPEQGVGQSAVRPNGLGLTRGVLAQVDGSATVLRHGEQEKATQLPGVLVVSIDAQHPVGVFQGSIQSAL